MNVRSKLLFASICLVSVALTSCGTSTAPIAATGLNGNWNLAGDRALGQYPLLSTTLTVNGDQITGYGEVFVECSVFGIGGSLVLGGPLASDGTFHLTQVLPPMQQPPTGIQVTIDGRVPAKGSTTWNGAYTITPSASPSLGCNGTSQDGSFTAMAFAPINATYSGTMDSPAFGPETGVSIQVLQGAPLAVQSPNGTSSTRYPLSGTISIQGSSCFKQGTTVGGKFLSDVSGDFINMGFVMDDGSQLLVTGRMTDTSEKNLGQTTFIVVGGNCDKDFGSGNLSVQ